MNRQRPAVSLKDKATALISRGLYAEAEQCLRDALEIEPCWSALYNNYGHLLQLMGNDDEAQRLLEKAIVLNPQVIPAIRSLFKYYIRNGNYDKAAGLVRHGEIYLPENSEMKTYEVSLLNTLGLFSQARKIGLEHASKFPSGELYAEIIYACIELSEVEDGALIGKEHYALGLGCQEFIINYSACLQKTGALVEAEKVITQSSISWADDPRLLESLGCICRDLGRKHDASNFLKAALELKPYDARLGLLAFSIADTLREQYLLWHLYENRFNKPEATRRYDIKVLPRWDGLVRGSDIVLVRSEQGIGDAILAYRLLYLFCSETNTDARFIFEVDKRLKLLLPAHKSIRIVAGESSNKTSAHALCNKQIDMISSVPVIMEKINALDGFSEKQVRVLAELAEETKKQVARSIECKSTVTRSTIVGFTWKSLNPELGAAQSIDIGDAVDALVRNKRDLDQIISLQYLPTENEQSEIVDRLGWNALPRSDLFGNLVELARECRRCDYVITVSNVTAHLCGLLGIPTFLLLAEGSGYPWFWKPRNNKRSLFYKDISVLESRADGKDLKSLFSEALRHIVG